MRDHHGEAAVAKLVGGCGEVAVERQEGRLDEQPPATGRPVRDAVELRLAQPPDHVVAELGAAANREPDPLAREPLSQLAHAVGQVGDVGDEAGAHVGGGDHGACAVGEGGGRERDALVHRGRAVVDAREDVEVDVRVAHLPAYSAARGVRL